MKRRLTKPAAYALVLALVAEGRSIKGACSAAGIADRTVRERRQKDPEFAAAFDQARREGGYALEDEAVRRAVEGTEEPIFHDGVQVGAVQRRSDSLLRLLLRGNKPKTYSQRVEPTIEEMSEEQMRERLAELTRGHPAG